MIINSIRDTDLYKLTMQQAVMSLFPDVQARYELIFRTPVKFSQRAYWKLNEEMNNMILHLKGSGDDAKILNECTSQLHWQDNSRTQLFSDYYLHKFSEYEFKGEEIHLDWSDGHLKITIEGPWQSAILWETPLMALISEVFYLETLGNLKMYDLEEFHRDKVIEKARKFEDLRAPIFEYGTRRRFSKRYQRQVLRALSECAANSMRGTSNVQLYDWGGVRPYGTLAHEWFMFHAAKYGYRHANVMALTNWRLVYDKFPDMWTGLTDTFTTEAFLKNNPVVPYMYSSLRQDSGDPLEFIKKIIPIAQEYYHLTHRKLQVIFSDSLNFDKVKRIYNYLRDEKHDLVIADYYGIGTNLTNDLPGVTPLNMVIKLTGVKMEKTDREWISTVKIGDGEGKELGPHEEIARCRRDLEIC